MLRSRSVILALIFAVVASAAFAQGNPTGTITGRVTDPDNLALPGVTVTAAVAGAAGRAHRGHLRRNGDYIIPFLPVRRLHGDVRTAGVRDGQAGRQPEDGRHSAGQRETGARRRDRSGHREGGLTETATTTTVATTIKADTVETDSARAHARGRHAAGSDRGRQRPGGTIMISGALSYDNLNLVNGVNVNDTQRQQPRPLFVEDAIQETKVSTGNISAEYGRFQGGVVNMITKSGGNDFSGSFRTTFTNDALEGAHAVPGRREHRRGGAGLRADVRRSRAQGQAVVLHRRAGSRTTRRTSRRRTPASTTRSAWTTSAAKGKLTYALNPRNTFKVSYFRRRARLHERQLQHDHGRGQPVQLERRRVADRGELPGRADQQPVHRGAVPRPARHGHHRRRVQLHGPPQGHADLGPARAARRGSTRRPTAPSARTPSTS